MKSANPGNAPVSIARASRGWTAKLREDTLESINLLLHFGLLDPDTHFDLREENGRAFVAIWLCDSDGRFIPESAIKADPVDLIVGLGTQMLGESKKFTPG